MSTGLWSGLSPQDVFSILASAGRSQRMPAASATAPNSFIISSHPARWRGRFAGDPDTEQGEKRHDGQRAIDRVKNKAGYALHIRWRRGFEELAPDRRAETEGGKQHQHGTGQADTQIG